MVGMTKWTPIKVTMAWYSIRSAPSTTPTLRARFSHLARDTRYRQRTHIRLDVLVAHRTALSSHGLSAAEVASGLVARSDMRCLGLGFELGGLRLPLRLRYAIFHGERLLVPRLPGRVVGGKEAGPTQADRLAHALVSDRDLRSARSKTQARPGFRQVHGHAG
jgi:hypothetical protein